jgi:uncharacterized membrane protein
MPSPPPPFALATGPPRTTRLSNAEIAEIAEGLARLRRDAATRDAQLGQLREEIRRLQDTLDHEARLRGA